MHDLRYALRVLKNNPGFTLAAVLTLGLGIGLNTTIFSLFDALALRPLDLPGREPVVSIYQDIRGIPRSSHGAKDYFSYAEYQTYRDDNEVFSGLAGYMPEMAALVGSDVTPVRGQLTSCNFFSVLEAPLALGRAFAPAECASDDAGPVIVLSDEFWRSRFNADPHILGQTIKLNRVALTVIGVAGPSFHGTEIVRPSFWAPLSMQWSLFGRQDTASYLRQTDMSWLAMVGRLKNGVSIGRAKSQLSIIARRIDDAQPARSTTLSLGRVSLLGEPEEHKVAFAIGSVFLVAVGLVLLIACANVANLFLARAVARQREIAVRLAIGASRARLVRQLLTESALIAFAGGTLGTLVALWSGRAVAGFIGTSPTDTPIALSVAPDVRVFAYAFLLVGVTALGFGLVPALQATRVDLNRSLKAGDAGSGSARSRLRHAVVGIQVATCMVLLIVAGLFLRGLNRAETVDPGWDMDQAVALRFDLQREGYTPQRAAAFTRDLAARLEALPGAGAVGEGAVTPLDGRHDLSAFKTPSMSKGITSEYAIVSAGYLSSVNLPIVRGRDFIGADVESAVPVMVVNESAARRFWPGQDPVGRTLTGYKKTYNVIGVVRDAELSALGKRHEPYLFIGATPADALNLSAVIVRSQSNTSSMERAMRAAALSLDPDIHVRVAPLRDNLRPYIMASQLFGAISAALGGLGLLLASLGIYGTVAFNVARRTREIGIRVALGAYGAQVTRMIVRQSMRPVVIGAIVGMVLCAAVSGFLAPVLFGVSGHDAVAFAGVPAFLLLVAIVASYAPARRAVRVNPVEALRTE